MNQLENNNSSEANRSWNNQSTNNLQAAVNETYCKNISMQRDLPEIKPADENFSLVPSTDIDTEHRIALKALQDEIAFHQRMYDRETYLDRALSYVYDDGRSAALNKLETAYQNEQNQTSHINRTDLQALLQEDQKSFNSYTYVDSAVGLTGTALATFAGPAGRLAAGTLLALNSAHPNDSASKQMFQVLGGFGLGSLAASGFAKSYTTSSASLSLLLRTGSYPLASAFTRNQLSTDQGASAKPDLDKITAEISAQTKASMEERAPKYEAPSSPYLPGLELNSVGEWSDFNVLK